MGSNRTKKIVKVVKTKAEVSKILKIAPKELNEFEDEGLFEFADRAHQLIDEQNFERLRVATALRRDLGVNIAGIEVILNMREKMTRMRTDMNSFLNEVRKKLGHNLKRDTEKLKKELE